MAEHSKQLMIAIATLAALVIACGADVADAQLPDATDAVVAVGGPVYGGPAGGGSPPYLGPLGGGSPSQPVNPNVGPGPTQASGQVINCGDTAFTGIFWNYIVTAINSGAISCCRAFQQERSLMANYYRSRGWVGYPVQVCSNLYNPGLRDMFPTTPPNPVGCIGAPAITVAEFNDLSVDVVSTTNLYIAALALGCPGVP